MGWGDSLAEGAGWETTKPLMMLRTVQSDFGILALSGPEYIDVNGTDRWQRGQSS